MVNSESLNTGSMCRDLLVFLTSSPKSRRMTPRRWNFCPFILIWRFWVRCIRWEAVSLNQTSLRNIKIEPQKPLSFHFRKVTPCMEHTLPVSTKRNITMVLRWLKTATFLQIGGQGSDQPYLIHDMTVIIPGVTIDGTQIVPDVPKAVIFLQRFWHCGLSK